MVRSTALLFLSLAIVGVTADAQAQGRWDRRDRNQVARLQGVPPGQMPPADLCRVFFDNRGYGRQPSAMNCRQAEAIAARDRDARVIYGENAFAYRNGYGNSGDSRWERSRDPRLSDGYYDRARTPAYDSGFRDGLQRGREDANRRSSSDLNRHGWYRSADRGYDNRDGSRTDYSRWYREGFEAGYGQAYGGYVRR